MLKEIRSSTCREKLQKSLQTLLTGFVLIGAMSLFWGCDQAGNGTTTVPASQTSEHSGDPRTNGAATADPTDGARPIPPVEVSPAILNFGTLKPHEVVNGSVDLKNVGDRPLRIRTSRASCQCTAVDLSNVIIEPGESVPLKATFDAGDTLGPRSAAVRILFDGGYELLEVAITAEVTFPVKAEPSYIDAQSVLVGEFTVSSLDRQPFRILGVNGTPPAFVGFDPDVDQPRNEYVLQWDFTGVNPQTCLDQNGEPLPEYWAIETDHPDCGIFDLQIRHQCTRPVIPKDGRKWVLPGSRTLLGQLAPSESGEFDITLVWLRQAKPDDSIFNVTSSSPDQFDAELVDTKRIGDEITCRVRITPRPGHKGLIYGTVLFHSSRHVAPYLVIGRVEG